MGLNIPREETTISITVAKDGGEGPCVADREPNGWFVRGAKEAKKGGVEEIVDLARRLLEKMNTLAREQGIKRLGITDDIRTLQIEGSPSVGNSLGARLQELDITHGETSIFHFLLCFLYPEETAELDEDTLNRALMDADPQQLVDGAKARLAQVPEPEKVMLGLVNIADELRKAEEILARTK